AGQGGAIPLTMGLLSGNYPRQRNGRLMAFKLGADLALPEVEVVPPTALELGNAGSDGDPSIGGVLFGGYCLVCHGPMALSAGPIPDLRFSAAILEPEVFSSIVHDGVLAERGMVGFAADLSREDVENIRSYLLQ